MTGGPRWLDRCWGTEGMRAVFGRDEVRSDGWRLVSMGVERNEVRAVVDLRQFPSAPPRAWVANGNDTVHAHLSFGSLDRLTLEGRLHPDDRVALALEPLGDHDVAVSLQGEGLTVAASRSDGVSITRIVGVRSVLPADAAAAERADIGAWLPGVHGGRPVSDAFAPEPAPTQPGALRLMKLFPAQAAATLAFDLDAHPRHTPPGWHDAWNTMTVTLRFDGVSRLSGEVRHGRPWEMSVQTTVSRTGDGVAVHIAGEAIDCAMHARTASVTRVAGYLKG